MIEKLCNKLTKKIQNKMPEIDDERAEVINYGLQLVIGEIPKTFVLLAIAYAFGVLKFSILALLFIMPYRTFSGGVHLKTHIGCLTFTTIFYCIIPFISQHFIMSSVIKYVVIFAVWIFGMIMIKLYAPADTENVPILNLEVRKKKQIFSYITFTIGLLVAGIVENSTIANILILANLFQTITITKFIYKATNNKYGFEVYDNTSLETV